VHTHQQHGQAEDREPPTVLEHKNFAEPHLLGSIWNAPRMIEKVTTKCRSTLRACDEPPYGPLPSKLVACSPSLSSMLASSVQPPSRSFQTQSKLPFVSPSQDSGSFHSSHSFLSGGSMGVGTTSSSSGSPPSTVVMPKESGGMLSACLHTCLSACHPHQYPLSTLPSHCSGLVQVSQANASTCCCRQTIQAAPNSSRTSPTRILVLFRSLLKSSCRPSCIFRNRRTCRRSRRLLPPRDQSGAFPPDGPPRVPKCYNLVQVRTRRTPKQLGCGLGWPGKGTIRRKQQVRGIKSDASEDGATLG